MTDRVRPDTVFMPFHWSGAGSVNRITNDATDPVSGMPEFKVCAVDVAAAPAAAPAAGPHRDRARARPSHRGGRMTRVVVVGNGMVGARFVEDLLAADHTGRYRVTVLGAEDGEPYNRVLLSEVVAGRSGVSTLTLPSPATTTGSSCSAACRPPRSTARTGPSSPPTAAGTATTSSCWPPGPRPGSPRSPGWRAHRGPAPGVHPLRTIDDAREIVAATLNARRAVVLGGGVLGLEAASGLAQRGCDVTVVHPAAGLMERQLDAGASRVVESAMTGLGIDHRIGVGAEAVLVEEGSLRGVRLSDGEVLGAELLVLATGTTPDTALAAAAGLPTDRGVLVDAALASVGDRRVFAVGDCAQPPEGGTGLVAQGWEQSRRLAATLCGAGPLPAPGPGGGTDVVRLKADGLDVVTMGVCGSRTEDDPAQRTLRLSDPDEGRHVEVVVAGGVLVGATCVGAGQVAADLVAAYTRRSPCRPTRRTSC